MSWSDTSIPMAFESYEDLQTKIDRYFLSCMSPVMEYIKNPEYDREEHDRCIENGEEYEIAQNIRVEKRDGNGDIIYEIIEPLTISGLALALGTNRATLLRYQHELQSSMDPEELKKCSYAIKVAKNRIENYLEKYMHTGKNQTTAIFMAKNNFDWVDRTEQDLNLGTVDEEKVKDKVGKMFG